jgi:hypothetical protein
MDRTADAVNIIIVGPAIMSQGLVQGVKRQAIDLG